MVYTTHPEVTGGLSGGFTMASEPEEFSLREQEVAKLLLAGKSNKEMAVQLGISTRAVEFHLTHLYEKLGVCSRVEALIRLINTSLFRK